MTEEFFQAFLECALWSTVEFTEEGNMGESLDANYDVDDIAPETLAELRDDCESFCDDYSELLSQAGDDEQNGHDFWLTRNGHGAGFWDRGYGEVGEKLSDACRPYGSVDLYVGDDGKIHA